MAGDRILEGLARLNERLIALSNWVAQHKEEVADFVKIVGLLAAAFLSAKLAGDLLGGALNILKSIIGFLCSPAGVLLLIIGLIAGICTAAGNAKEMIENLKEGFRAFGEFISGVFTGNWEKAWNGIKDIFKSILNGMVIIFESVINLIIDGVNHLVGKVNSIEINIPSWVPGLGGKGWSPGIPSIPHCSLPRLASGAVIPPKAEFLAVLGDQRNGRNLEAPENLIRQIVREESSFGQNESLLPLVVELDGSVLYRSMEKVKRDRGAVIGGAFASAY